MWLFSKKKASSINSPVNNGQLKTLSSLNDGVFSEKMMGNGFAVTQSDGKVYAPISGKLVTVFPTKHAYGIENKNGLNVLIHIGIDTVNLEGQGFKSYVEQGQEVKQGDLLAEVDLDYLENQDVISDVICIVTNDSKVHVKDSEIKTSGNVSINDVVIDLK